MKPCPICRGSRVFLNNVGYSRYCKEWFHCPDCGLRIGLDRSDRKEFVIDAETWSKGRKIIAGILRVGAKMSLEDRKSTGIENTYGRLLELRNASRCLREKNENEEGAHDED